MGQAPRKALAGQNGAIALDTFGGRIHVEWDPTAAVAPLGQLPFFIEVLKVSGVFEAWVTDCPLAYQSNHASDKRAVLATLLLSILAGHHRYAPITAIRYDGIHPELLGVSRLVSEDVARRALARIDELSGVAGIVRVFDVQQEHWHQAARDTDEIVLPSLHDYCPCFDGHGHCGRRGGEVGLSAPNTPAARADCPTRPASVQNIHSSRGG
ncbi:MAG: hypothetical protein P0120_04675 [Nitrospira sp.]|nr:hypothetical protein [Nitrospira sp.]